MNGSFYLFDLNAYQHTESAGSYPLFRYVMHDLSARQKKKMEDADMHLAQKIAQNKQYSTYGQADDEYDYDDGPRRKSRKKVGMENQKSLEVAHHAKRVLTQQERCQFCFENPTRPKHLVVAIANFTYLSLPVWQPIVPGHCCILTMQVTLSPSLVIHLYVIFFVHYCV